MKKGFTLQEVLIVLGVIGIVAALTIPNIAKLFPNEYKAKYVKAYNTLTRVVSDMVQDESLYPTLYKNDGTIDAEGLASSYKIDIAPYNDSNSDYYIDTNVTTIQKRKFDKIFASKLNLNEAPTWGTDSTFTTFVTQDGTKWFIDSDVTGNNYARFDVGIDVDPNNSTGKDVYSSTNTNPHRFLFTVDKDGGVKTLDKMGRAYLMNSASLHDINKDQTAANNITLSETDQGLIDNFKHIWDEMD